MVDNILSEETIFTVSIDDGLNRFKRYFVKRFHPRSLFFDSIGMMWAIYYLWFHQWTFALGAILLMRVLSVFSVMNVSAQSIAGTTLGKIALIHLHPANMIIQLGGITVLVYGIWQHSVELTMIGVSFILLGHIFGWSNVDERFGRVI